MKLSRSSAVDRRSWHDNIAEANLSHEDCGREVWPGSPVAPGDMLALRISEDQLEPSPTKAP